MAKILLIEDELLWQQTLTQILQRKNHEVVLADSYENAQAYLTLTAEVAPDFDLVLLDLILDEWSGELKGMELLPVLEVLHTQRNASVIILTDHDMYANTVEAARNALTEHKDTVFGVYDKNRLGDGKEFLSLMQQASGGLTFREDWWKPLDVGAFYGRQEQIATLKQWMLIDQCRLVTLLGGGGIGKSSLALKVAEEVSDQFDYIFGRDLRNAPPLDEVLSDGIKFLSDQQKTDLPGREDEKITLLIEYLQSHRCLLVLDNLETILQGGKQAGQYRAGYEGYGQLIQCAGETAHQSCVLVTSRERPGELEHLEISPSVKILELTGLQPVEGKKILRDRSVFGTEEKWTELTVHYAGNPLALKLVASTIGEVFGGDIAEFLSQQTMIFGGIRDVLDQQFTRLSEREQEVMYWLAINREAVSLEELQDDIVESVSEPELLEIIESVQARSMVETSRVTQFILQPVVLEYVTEQFVEHVCEEIRTKDISLFMSHALIKAQAKDYVRESQIRLILEPIAKALIVSLGIEGVKNKLKEVLSTLHKVYSEKPGYGGGNLINLLVYLGIKPSGYDFSNLTIWQAYLRNIEFHDVNFAHAQIARSVFNDTFSTILSVAFSHNKKLLASGAANGDVQIWQLPEVKKSLVCKAHNDLVWSVAFSPNDSIFATGSSDKTIRLWDINNGQHKDTLRGHTGRVRSVCFNPNEDMDILASGSDDRSIKLWNVSNRECIKTLTGHEDRVRSIAFNSNGNTLASCSEDETVRLWDVGTGECLKVLQGHTQRIWSIAFNLDSSILASGSDDQTVRLWDVSTGQCLKILRGHTHRVKAVAFSLQDNHILASGSEDQTVKLWDVHSGKCLKTLQGHTNWVWSVAFSPDSSMFVSGGEDHTIQFWDIKTGQCVKTLQGYANGFGSIAFSPDNHLLASGSEDQIVRLWDVKKGTCLKALYGHKHRVRSVAFSSDGHTLASSSEDQTVRLWDIHTGECLNVLEGHTHWIWSAVFSPDGDMLASGSDDHTIKLWNIKRGECVKTLQGHKQRVRSVAFSPDGHILASGSEDQTIKLWDVYAGECIKTLEGHTNWVWSVAFNPDDNAIIVSGGDDYTVRLWDIKEEKCFKILEGHKDRVRSVTFSHNGQMIASGSEDRSVILWDVHTGRCINVFKGHIDKIVSVVFNFKDNLIASSGDSGDEMIKLWDIKTEREPKTLKVDKPYERINITGVIGLTEAQKLTLKTLGAVEDE